MQENVVQAGTASGEVRKTTRFQKRLQERERKAGLTDGELSSLTRTEIYRRLGAAVGATPIRKTPLPNGNVLVQKDETKNPTETHYDRCYVHLLERLEREGTISPGDMLLETTSGSAGVSFAWVCKKLGYEAVVFMPSCVPEPRIIEVQSMAAAVHLNDNRELYLLGCANDMVGYLRANRERVAAQGRRIYMPDHSRSADTPGVFGQIIQEVETQLEGQQVDYFVGGIGNGSTLLGVGEKAKEIFPELKVVAFEPLNACPFYKKYREKWGTCAPRFVEEERIPDSFSFHQLPGTGTFGNVDFPFMERAIERGVIDDVCPIPEHEILPNVRYNDELPAESRHGNTTLVARYIAEEMARGVSGKTFLTLAYDRADRYGTPHYL